MRSPMDLITAKRRIDSNLMLLQQSLAESKKNEAGAVVVKEKYREFFNKVASVVTALGGVDRPKFTLEGERFCVNETCLDEFISQFMHDPLMLKGTSKEAKEKRTLVLCILLEIRMLQDILYLQKYPNFSQRAANFLAFEAGAELEFAQKNRLDLNEADVLLRLENLCAVVQAQMREATNNAQEVELYNRYVDYFLRILNAVVAEARSAAEIVAQIPSPTAQPSGVKEEPEAEEEKSQGDEMSDASWVDAPRPDGELDDDDPTAWWKQGPATDAKEGDEEDDESDDESLSGMPVLLPTRRAEAPPVAAGAAAGVVEQQQQGAQKPVAEQEIKLSKEVLLPLVQGYISTSLVFGHYHGLFMRKLECYVKGLEANATVTKKQLCDGLRGITLFSLNPMDILRANDRIASLEKGEKRTGETGTAGVVNDLITRYTPAR